jgi:hypothetical protein
MTAFLKSSRIESNLSSAIIRGTFSALFMKRSGFASAALRRSPKLFQICSIAPTTPRSEYPIRRLSLATFSASDAVARSILSFASGFGAGGMPSTRRWIIVAVAALPPPAFSRAIAWARWRGGNRRSPPIAPGPAMPKPGMATTPSGTASGAAATPCSTSPPA